MHNYAIITAGGSGTRLPGFRKKQFLRLGDAPVYLWPVLRMLRHPRVGRVVLVLPKEDYGLGRDMLEEQLLQQCSCYADKLWFAMGGDTRRESVYNGLQMTPDDAGLILAHDGVRPFFSDTDVDLLLDAAERVGGAIPVHPVKHTVKRVQDGLIAGTVDRSGLVEVSTPQVFRAALLRQRHEQAREDSLDVTDDAGLLEHYGDPVAAVEVSFPNLKITDRLDLALAKQMLSDEDKALWTRSLHT